MVITTRKWAVKEDQSQLEPQKFVKKKADVGQKESSWLSIWVEDVNEGLEAFGA